MRLTLLESLWYLDQWMGRIRLIPLGRQALEGFQDRQRQDMVRREIQEVLVGEMQLGIDGCA